MACSQNIFFSFKHTDIHRSTFSGDGTTPKRLNVLIALGALRMETWPDSLARAIGTRCCV